MYKLIYETNGDEWFTASVKTLKEATRRAENETEIVKGSFIKIVNSNGDVVYSKEIR